MIELIAMSPTGETRIHRGFDGSLSMSQPEGLGGFRYLTEQGVEDAIRHMELTRVERDFDSLEALDRFVQEEASKIPMPERRQGPMTLEVAREQLKVAERWLTQTSADRHAAARYALRLLEEPAVLRVETLRRRALAILREHVDRVEMVRNQALDVLRECVDA